MSAEQCPEVLPAGPVLRATSSVTGSFYSPGTFPRSTPAAPPIYRVAGGGRRPQEHVARDGQLRAAVDCRELLRLVAAELPGYDTGSVVVAFTSAAKLDSGRDMTTLWPQAPWLALQERLVECADELEPRGMSMVAYAAAKLMWGDSRLLHRLARAGLRRVQDFGATDVSKSTWAFAKLRFVAEPLAHDFWKAVAREAPSKIRAGRFVDTSMTAWAFATADWKDDQVFAAVAASTRAICDTLPPRSLAGIAWSCARARYYDGALFGDLSRHALAAAAIYA